MNKAEAIARLVSFRDWHPDCDFELVSAEDLKEAISFILEGTKHLSLPLNENTEHDELSNILP